MIVRAEAPECKDGASGRADLAQKKVLKEGKNAVKRTRLACHDFTDSKVRLQLSAFAQSLKNVLRRRALPRSVN